MKCDADLMYVRNWGVFKAEHLSPILPFCLTFLYLCIICIVIKVRTDVLYSLCCVGLIGSLHLRKANRYFKNFSGSLSHTEQLPKCLWNILSKTASLSLERDKTFDIYVFQMSSSALPAPMFKFRSHPARVGITSLRGRYLQTSANKI